MSKFSEVNKRLIAIFEEHGFSIDFEGSGATSAQDSELHEHFVSDSFRTLFYFGFKPFDDDVSAGVRFLHGLSERMIGLIAKRGDIEFLRENAELGFSDDELSKMVRAAPFAPGMEYITKAWLRETFSRLGEVFKIDIAAYSGTVAQFLTEQKSDLTVMGRVFFHLVENKNDEMPFAFLATYSTPSDTRKINHVPLKNAPYRCRVSLQRKIQSFSIPWWNETVPQGSLKAVSIGSKKRDLCFFAIT
ncbi:MAG: hypothetical protein FWD58_02010 [Firmicutes bacterium]|nr:hypothetical protein [Bacillota bacterium]